jgi:hypothetical protein
MFGTLLLILASEICRDKASEDAVWPAVTSVLKKDAVTYRALFVAGQPTELCKSAMAAGARQLNLRNVIHRYGTQEYFDTLKLQFGFTYRGAVRRLADWLDGLGVPIAVRVLTGSESEYCDLASASFTELWSALRNFRHGDLAEEYVRALLQRSPWSRPEWSTELLKAAKLRAERSATVQTSPAHTPQSVAEPLCEPLLRWPTGGKPQFLLRLNNDRIIETLGESSTAVFTIDGRVIARWALQEDGTWRGSRELPCQPEAAPPNLRPKLLTISANGAIADEIDLIELGLSEPLLVFELASGRLVSRTSKLNARQDCAFICDRDFSLSTAPPSLLLKDRSAYRVIAPWPRDLKVLCDGLIYWEPNIGERSPVSRYDSRWSPSLTKLLGLGPPLRFAFVVSRMRPQK